MNKHCLLYLSFFFAMLITAIASASDDTLPVKQIPREGSSLQAFLPNGWTVEMQKSGDLNGDGTADILAMLIQDKPALDPDGVVNQRYRGLIVLLNTSDNAFRLAGTNDSLLQCTTCGGVKGTVYMDIKKGVIILSQMSGSREFVDVTWRFRHDAKTQRFLLIGKDVENGDSILGTGTIESCNCLTGQKITKTYRYDQTGERKIILRTTKGGCPKATPFLEQIGAEQEPPSH